MKMIARQFTINHLDTTDFYDTVALRRLQAGSLGIKYNFVSWIIPSC